MVDLKQGDCLELMKDIPDGSVDMVLTDPPYGTTACKWDSVIPFEPMWEQLNRIIKPNGAICLFGSEPFSSALRMSNIKNFKYDWIWEKTRTVGFLNAKNAPLKRHEIVSVFSLGTTANCSKNRMEYNPQGLIEINQKRKSVSQSGDTVVGSRPSRSKDYIAKYTGYPDTVLRISNEKKQEHPTQKRLHCLNILSVHIQTRVKLSLTSQWEADQQALPVSTRVGSSSAWSLTPDILKLRKIELTRQ